MPIVAHIDLSLAEHGGDRRVNTSRAFDPQQASTHELRVTSAQTSAAREVHGRVKRRTRHQRGETSCSVDATDVNQTRVS